MPKLYIFDTCVNTISELETYRWRERKANEAQDLNKPDVPEKSQDHICDSLRYFAVSYKAQSLIDKQIYGDDYQFVNPPTKVWRIGANH